MARSLDSLIVIVGLAVLGALWMRPDGRAVLVDLVAPLAAHAAPPGRGEQLDYAPAFVPGESATAAGMPARVGGEVAVASAAGTASPPAPLSPATPELLDAPPGVVPSAPEPLRPAAAAPIAVVAPPNPAGAAAVVPAAYGPGFDAPVGPADAQPPVPAASPPAAPAAPPQAPAAQPVAAPPPPEAGVENATVLTSAAVVARVDGEVILAADIMGPIERFMAQRAAEIPPEQADAVRAELARQRIAEMVEVKLLYNDARRTIPKENFPNLEKEVNKTFAEEELPNMLKQYQVASPAQLDEILRSQGDSLENSKRRFREMYLARGWLSEKARDTREITHDDMLAYYKAHEAEYRVAAQSRWEQLTVRFDRVRDRGEAQRKIAWMGNQVMGGRPWAEIARAYSNGPTAEEGGLRDWTTLGSLKSLALERAIFTLPPGAMSPIIEDETGLHIVRVIERKSAGQTSLGEAQAEIKEKIKQERRKAKQDEYFAKVKSQAQVWTIFDTPEGAAFFARGPQSGLLR